MAEAENHLSRSMEDYLEAIYNLKVRREVARVKDIARELDVKMPSVTGAIRSLVDKGLVRHQPYECVELTDEGLDRARAVAHIHSAVKEFLVSVLDLSEEDAEREACGIEHAIEPDTLDRLLKFVDFVRSSEAGRPLSLDHFRHYLKHGIYPEQRRGHPRPEGARLRRHGVCPSRPTITSTKLSEVRPGTKGRIAFVSGRGAIRKRLMDMGVTSDAEFEVVRVAPMGDPVEIKVRGYYLSLRKSEAEHIEVEVE